MTNANDHIKVNFTPEHLVRLMPFKAVHDIRYYLNGIYVEKAERGGVYLVATDGHTMAVVHDATGSIEGAGNCIFSVEPGLATAAKATAKRGNVLVPYRVCIENNRVKVACPGTDLELFIQPGKCIVEGKFPDWKNILPKDFSLLKDGLSSPLINAVYLARFAKIVSARFSGIRFWQESPEKVLIVQMPQTPEMIALIMPMRDGGGPGKFESFTFVKPAVEEPVAA